jgi:hypothetical protein
VRGKFLADVFRVHFDECILVRFPRAVPRIDDQEAAIEIVILAGDENDAIGLAVIVDIDVGTRER